MLVLLNLKIEVNAIYPTFAKELGFSIKPSDIRVQKINGTTLNIYEIVVTAFLGTNKANQVKFFEEIFLITNVSLKIILRMLFLTLSNEDVNILDWELQWRIYITQEALSTTRRIEFVEKIKFAVVMFDPEHETFIVYITSLSFVISLNFTLLNVDVHPFHRS